MVWKTNFNQVEPCPQLEMTICRPSSEAAHDVTVFIPNDDEEADGKEPEEDHQRKELCKNPSLHIQSEKVEKVCSRFSLGEHF